MGTWIVAGIMLVLFVLAVIYIVRKKKSGGCVGCPGGGESCNCEHSSSCKSEKRGTQV
jgi:hypothetical protein